MRLVVLFLLFSSPLLATSAVELSRRASILYEAGEWAEAASLYRTAAAKPNLSAEQRAKVRFNLACALIASGDLCGALDQLDTAYLNCDPSAELEGQWHLSRALASWKRAVELAEEEQVASLAQGIEQCHDGWESLQIASNNLMGEFAPLRAALKETAAQLRRQQRQLELSEIATGDLLAYLLKQSNGAIAGLEQIHGERGQQARLSRAAASGRKIADAWAEIHSRLPSDAAALFEDGLESVDRGYLWEGRAALAHAALLLQLQLSNELGSDPLRPLLEQRVALESRLSQRPPAELAEALEQQKEQLCTVGAEVARQGSELAVDPVHAHLIGKLAERLEKSGLDRSRYDLLLYEQMTEPEDQTLLRLYGQPDALGSKALVERFEARASVEANQDLSELLGHLRAGRIGDALRLWSPPSWLRAKLHEARVDAEGVATSQLVDQLGPLLEVAKEHCPEEVIASIEWAKEDAASALAQLSQNHPASSEVCMIDARYRLLKGESALEPPDEEEEPITGVIEEQKHLLEVTQALEQAAGRETILGDVVDLAERGQQGVLDLAYKIHPDTFEQEKRALFLQGSVEAEGARRTLSMRRPDWNKAISQQRRAIELWEQLLSSGDGEQDQQSDSESESELPQEEDESVATAEQIYEWLEQMEREDRQNQPPSPKVKQGARPW